MFLLGLFWFLLFFALVGGAAVFILTKVAPGVNARQRRRQIETAMRLRMFDQQVIDDIVDEMNGEGR
jgi:hypothetical protein